MRVNAQLIDAGGAHLWAEQFDTPRVDLLQTQDAIITHLTRAIDFQLTEVEAARLKRTPAANPNAEDLALQCGAGQWKAGSVGKEADAAYALCEQALAIDPNNVRALMGLGNKFFMLAALGGSSDPKGDLERADELVSKARALDPDWSWNHDLKGAILRFQARYPEAVAEHERALALDPSNVDAIANLGWDHIFFGHFDKGLEYFDKAIRTSPYDPGLASFYGGKAWANFGLKNYDQAIDWARQAIAINPNYVHYIHSVLVAALALTGHDAEAREALRTRPPHGLHRAVQDDRGIWACYSPHRVAIHPASRRTSGCTTACARPECPRNKRASSRRRARRQPLYSAAAAASLRRAIGVGDLVGVAGDEIVVVVDLGRGLERLVHVSRAVLVGEHAAQDFSIAQGERRPFSRD